MSRSTRSILRTALISAAVASLTFAVVGVAGSRHDGPGHHKGSSKVFTAKLLPSTPSPAGPTVNGVNPGGKPWLLRRGSAVVRRDGSLTVRVRGLVFTESGTTTPNGGAALPAVSASLFCNGATTAVGTTAAAPLSPTGDAKITGMVTLPATCAAPVVMVHPNTNVAAYIAISGFGG